MFGGQNKKYLVAAATVLLIAKEASIFHNEGRRSKNLTAIRLIISDTAKSNRKLYYYK